MKTRPAVLGGASRRIDRLKTDPPGSATKNDTLSDDTVPGRHAVLEALRAGRALRKILVARTAHGAAVREILRQAKARGVVVQFVDPRHLRGAPGAQGVVALTSARPVVGVEEILAAAAARSQPPFVLVCDGIEDPANLGAILRTADAAGVHGVVIPRRRAAGLTPAVAKASAGAIEHVPVAQVANVVQALDGLKAAGLWVAGADPNAGALYNRARLVPPLALVVGGEERGLSRLVREHCDFLVRLPMRGHLASLNVSVAVGVLLYEVLRQSTDEFAGPSTNQ